jgi:hypothetical protein
VARPVSIFLIVGCQNISRIAAHRYVIWKVRRDAWWQYCVTSILIVIECYFCPDIRDFLPFAIV